MKSSSIIRLFIVAVIALIFFSCKTKNTSYIPSSKGAPYDVFVVMDTNKWNGDLGLSFKRILCETVPMLNQPEPMFRVTSFPAKDFSRLMKHGRSVIIVEIDKKYESTQMQATYDMYAQPQILITVTGPSDTAVMNYLENKGSALKTVINMFERDCFVKATSNKYDKELQLLIEKKFGFNLTLPTDYRLRVDVPDFLWISNEMPLISQGVVIYSYPYEGFGTFELNKMIEKRNEFVNKNIPGPTDGSFMTTASEEVAERQIRRLLINGREWYEIRGFWDVENDYMGGPFISYSTLDKATNRVIVIDNYLYSPKKPKRNFYRQLENLIYMVKFPDSAKQE